MAKKLPITIYRTDKDGTQHVLGSAATEQEALQKLQTLEKQFEDTDSYWAMNTRNGHMIDTSGLQNTQAGQLGVLCYIFTIIELMDVKKDYIHHES